MHIPRITRLRPSTKNHHLIGRCLTAAVVVGCAGDPASSDSAGAGGIAVVSSTIMAGGNGAKPNTAHATGGANAAWSGSGAILTGGDSTGRGSLASSPSAGGSKEGPVSATSSGGLSTTTRTGDNISAGGAPTSSSVRGGSGRGGAVTSNATGGTSGRGGASSSKVVLGGAFGRGGTSSGKATNGGVSNEGGASVVSAGGAARGGATSRVSTNSTSVSGGSSGVSVCPDATQTLTVAADGSGQYKTVQAAISAIPSNNSKPIRVSVAAGTYNEQVTINKPFVCLTGASATSTIITHTIDTNIVTGGTVLLTGNDFSAANITFQNSAPPESAQRVALMAKGLRQQFYDCRFVSYQDTLYTNTGTQYFRDCYIQGNTDFIFGD
ncbi:MAG TPA: pectinesterase family protein, partial [Polyangiaceae bacterium]|nr:pectinesterase family protein [Polyangiaceae bacterium]